MTIFPGEPALLLSLAFAVDSPGALLFDFELPDASYFILADGNYM
jgi:hypothetical protein